MSSGDGSCPVAGSGAASAWACAAAPTNPSFDDLANVRAALDDLIDAKRELIWALESLNNQIDRLKALLA